MGRFSRLFTKIVGPAAVIAAGTMGSHTATAYRNLILFVGLVMSVWIAIEKLPSYIEAFSSQAGIPSHEGL